MNSPVKKSVGVFQNRGVCPRCPTPSLLLFLFCSRLNFRATRIFTRATHSSSFARERLLRRLCYDVYNTLEPDDSNLQGKSKTTSARYRAFEALSVKLVKMTWTEIERSSREQEARVIKGSIASFRDSTENVNFDVSFRFITFARK